jgi:hypothetical protein
MEVIKRRVDKREVDKREVGKREVDKKGMRLRETHPPMFIVV